MVKAKMEHFDRNISKLFLYKISTQYVMMFRSFVFDV